MGTRSLTHIIVGDQKVVSIYQQYDGYLSCVGAEIYEIISKEHVNGYGDKWKEYNGPFNLAAMLVARFMVDNVSGKAVACGGVYLYNDTSHLTYIDYEYTIKFEENWYETLAEPIIQVKSYSDFSGDLTLAQFKAGIDYEETAARLDDDEDEPYWEKFKNGN